MDNIILNQIEVIFPLPKYLDHCVGIPESVLLTSMSLDHGVGIPESVLLGSTSLSQRWPQWTLANGVLVGTVSVKEWCLRHSLCKNRRT